MRIKCKYRDLFSALETVNQKYDGNVTFTEGTPARYTNKDLDWRVRLGVKDSHKAGAKMSIRFDAPFGSCQEKHRHTRAACWHVHGAFFDALPQGATIVSRGKTIHAGDAWEDFNVGSLMFPIYASESCEC